MTQTETNTPPAAQKNPYTLWFVVLAFVGPVVAAYALYFFSEPASFSNNGEILQPVVDVETLKLHDADGTLLLRDDATSRKWTMFYIAGSDCGQPCQQVLYNMRQINIAVGKNAYRLRHMLVHVEPMSAPFKQLIETEHERALHVYADEQQLQQTLGTHTSNIRANDIYLMDPIGNIMMRFPETLEPKLIINDLNKLFKVSQIG